MIWVFTMRQPSAKARYDTPIRAVVKANGLFQARQTLQSVLSEDRNGKQLDAGEDFDVLEVPVLYCPVCDVRPSVPRGDDVSCAASDAGHCRDEDEGVYTVTSPDKDPATVGNFTLRDGKPHRIFSDDGEEIEPVIGTALRVFNGTWECTGGTLLPDGRMTDREWTWHGDEER